MTGQDRLAYARRWFYTVAGHAEAGRRIKTEADILRVEFMSDRALVNALGTYAADTGRTPRNHPLPTEPLQEGLIP